MSLTNPTPEERAEAAKSLTYSQIHQQQIAADNAQGFGAPTTSTTAPAANAPTDLPTNEPAQPPGTFEAANAPPAWKQEQTPIPPEASPNAAPQAPAPSAQPAGTPVRFGQGQGAPQGQPSDPSTYHFAPPAAAAQKPTMDYRPQEAADKSLQDAIAAQGQGQASTAKAIADARDEGTKKQIAMQAADKVADDKTKEQLSNLRTRLQQKVDDHDKESIDPDHYWADKGQGARAFATIAMTLSNAFGGFAAGFQGREFHPDKTLSEAIDRDIASQKMNYEAHQKSIDNAQNLYAQNMAAFGDDKAAEAAARAEHWTMVEQQVQAIADKGGGEDKQKAADVLRAHANQEAVKAEAEAGQRYRLVTQKGETDRLMGEAAKLQAQLQASLHPGAGGHGGGQGAPAKPTAAAAPQYEARPLGKGDESRIFSLPDGSRVWVPVEGDKALIEAGKLTPAQAHAMHVADNPAGGLALTNRPYTGSAEYPGKAEKPTSPRVAFKQEAAEELPQLIDQLDKLENGHVEFGAKGEAGAELVGEIRDRMTQLGMNPEHYIPDGYNPTDAHLPGGSKSAVPGLLRGAVLRRAASTEKTVGRTRGAADVADPGS